MVAKNIEVPITASGVEAAPRPMAIGAAHCRSIASTGVPGTTPPTAVRAGASRGLDASTTATGDGGKSGL